jgi:hypothetical protein
MEQRLETRRFCRRCQAYVVLGSAVVSLGFPDETHTHEIWNTETISTANAPISSGQQIASPLGVSSVSSMSAENKLFIGSGVKCQADDKLTPPSLSR